MTAQDKLQKTDLTSQELLKLNNEDPIKAEETFNSLPFKQKLRLVLSAKGADRERLITMDKQGARIVAALPVDEFVRSVMDIGPEDAGSLLALSTDSQLTFLMDITGWVQEKLAPNRYEIWLPLIIEAGARKLTRWLASTDIEVLTLLFRHWFKVVKYLPSQEQQEPPDDLPAFTLDGVYFLDFVDQKASDVISQTLVALRNEMPKLYQNLMEAMLWENVAPLVEDALRWRNGRLMDLGFPDRMEALELWARPFPGEQDWQNQPTKDELRFLSDAPARSNAVAEILPPYESLPKVLGELDEKHSDRLRAELAYVANCGVVALGADPASPEEINRAAKESLGLVNMGLEDFSNGDLELAKQIVGTMGLPALARKGSSHIRSLNQEAWALLREGWLKDIPTNIYVLDPPLDRSLAGLVYPKPRCYDPGLKEGREYRAFLNMADIAQCRLRLNQAYFWGKLFFELMGINKEEFLSLWQAKIWPQDPKEIKTTAILGTYLANRALNLNADVKPVPKKYFNEAVRALQQGLDEKLPQEIKQSCQSLTDPEEAAMAGALLRSAVKRLELELARLNTDIHLDPNKTWGIITER